jgi:hypothetical protein
MVVCASGRRTAASSASRLEAEGAWEFRRKEDGRGDDVLEGVEPLAFGVTGA